ncbi:hypothetical protein EDB84DRAFT_1401264, partial [Lactarius hengduanensis]
PGAPSVPRYQSKRCAPFGHPDCRRSSQYGKGRIRAVFLGTETSPRSHPGLPLFSPLTKCLGLSGADVVVRSSDRVNFPVHKAILALSSSVFGN